MNIETGEVRDLSDLTDEERASGKWLRIPKSVTRHWQDRPKKIPKDSADYARVIAAEEKRQRRARKRAEAALRELHRPPGQEQNA